MRPLPELPASAVLEGDGIVHEALQVVDLSVGGLALTGAASASAGDRWVIRLKLGALGEHRLNVVVRWTAPAMAGVELVDPPADASHALGSYVSELLERGPLSQ